MVTKGRKQCHPVPWKCFQKESQSFVQLLTPLNHSENTNMKRKGAGELGHDFVTY